MTVRVLRLSPVMLVEPGIAASHEHVVVAGKAVLLQRQHGSAPVGPKLIATGRMELPDHSLGVLDGKIFTRVRLAQSPGVHHLRTKRIHEPNPIAGAKDDGSASTAGNLSLVHSLTGSR